MFKMTSGPLSVERKVTVNIPGQGNVIGQQTFFATFEIIGDEERQEIVLGEGNFLDGGLAGTKALLRRVLVGWREVGQVDSEEEDSNAEPFDFNEENVKKMIDIPYVRIALVESYDHAAAGRKVKNSKGPLGTG